MRVIKKYSIQLNEVLKKQILNWSQQFDEVIWLDTNEHQLNHTYYKAILAVDAITSIRTDFQNSFEELEEYQTLSKDWLFGYLSYDLKNDVENLSSNNFDGLYFPDLY